LALSSVVGASHAASLGFGLRLRADPDRVPADGHSSVVVSAEIADALGSPAPDGTPVYFVASLGEIVSPVQTIGGLAQTVLTASNAAGTALISAVAGTNRGTIQVEFLSEPGSASPGSRVVELAAAEVAYSAERRVFVATWKAELRYQTIEVRADGIQYDPSANIVCAQGNVALRSGTRSLQADALRYDLVSSRGRLIRLSERPERLLLEGSKLETRPDSSNDEALWEPLQTGDTRTWVKARRAVIEPGQKIILDHATFYINDTRVVSLRRHVLDPATGGAVFGQALGFSSASGLSVDLPLYYRASAQHIGSLHLTRNRTLGGVQWEPGWSLGLREEYLQQPRGEGAFEIDDLLHPDLGMRWEHRHRFGGGASMAVEASAISFGGDSPRLRTTSVSLFRPTGSGRASLLLSRSDYGQSEQSLGDLEYRFGSLRAGREVLVTPAARLRYSRSRSDAETVVFDPETGEPLQIAQGNTGRTTSPGLDLTLSLPSKEMAPGLRLNGGLTAGYAWGLADGSHGVLDGRLLVDRRFGPGRWASLGFSYSSGGYGVQPTFIRSSRKLLTLSGQTLLGGASLRASASTDLGGDRWFGSLHLMRPLPFGSDPLGRPLWNLELSHIFSRLGVYGASNTRAAVGRVVGRYLAALCYSPQGVGDLGTRPWMSPLGYGYTYSGSQHFWLELTTRPY
jgi:hypothetical protein